MKKILHALFLTVASLSFFSSSAQTCFIPVIDTIGGGVIQAGGITPYANTIKWNHNVSSSKGTNMLMLVQVACDSFPDSVSCAGINMTMLDSVSNGDKKAQLWYLLNPPAGTDSMRAYFPVGSGTFASHKSAESISLYNVDQSTPFGTVVKATDSICPTNLVARSDSNAIILDMIVKDYFYAVKADPSQTKLYGISYANGNAVGGSWKSGGDSVSFTWNWVFCNNYPWATIAVPVEGVCITGINEPGIQIISALYPNPSNAVLHVELSRAIKGEILFSVCDVIGKEVLQGAVSADDHNPRAKPINVSALYPGIYFLQMKTGGTAMTKMFMKE